MDLPSPDTPTSLVALIELLPQPCALTDAAGTLQSTNALWRDVFFNPGVGADLLSACAALFHWGASGWAGVEQELRLLLAGELERVTFEAQIAEPPERWAVCALGRVQATGGVIIQLTDVTSWQIMEAETARTFGQFRDAVDSISDGFAIYGPDDRLVFCNQRYREIYPKSSAMMIPGRSFEEIVRAGALRGQYPDAEGRMEEWIALRVALHQALGTTESQLDNGRWVRATDRRTSEGGIVCIRTDITDERQAAELRHQSEVQDEMLRAQEALLAELSTPILRISDRALVLPLIGAIDSTRAQHVVESLLEAVGGQGADLVLLDITGVPLVDTQVANVLIQCAKAVRLLGARMLLTGIRPDVAQTIVALGIDLGDIITRADLREGIAFALRKG